MSENSVFINAHSGASDFRKWAYERWLSLGITKALKRRRITFVDSLLDGALSRAETVMEIGCGSGRDFVKGMADSKARLFGLDPFDCGLRQENFTFTQGDVSHIPFEDQFFDVTLSFGVLEHIEPMEKLCKAASEIARVSKRYCMIVPSISTRFEPHFWEYRWQLKASNSRQRNVNYFRDATWLQFEGFAEAKIARHDYIPWLVTNLYVYS